MPTSNNGANNQTDNLVTPWNIRGWTAQAIPQDTLQVANDLTAPSPLPSNLVYVQVTGQYLDFDNNSLSGFLTFQMSESITVTSGGIIYRLPQRYAGRDGATNPMGLNNWGTGKIYIRHGLMSVTIMTTVNSAIVTDSGLPLTYHVVEHFPGGQQYDIAIPSNAVSPVDLRSLIVPGTITPYSFDPAWPLGNEGYTPASPAFTITNDIDGGTS